VASGLVSTIPGAMLPVQFFVALLVYPETKGMMPEGMQKKLKIL
jgi:hypothetical protein